MDKSTDNYSDSFEQASISEQTPQVKVGYKLLYVA